MQHVKKPHTILDLGTVDVSGLLARLAKLSDAAWQVEDSRKENAFAVFHDTRHIVHRFTPGNRTAADNYETPAWLIWRDLLQPVIDAAVRPYGYADPRVPKAMFARLSAGKVIDRHSDGAGSNLEAHKIHVPLVTNIQARFCVGDEGFHLERGRAYEVNNLRPHGAENLGGEDRIHFIFELFDGAQAA